MLVLALMTLAQGLHAATIAVTTTAMGDPVPGCGLTEAIKAVNNQSSYQGCTFVPEPATTITLPAGTFTTWTDLTLNYAAEIIGAGKTATIINSGGVWVLGSYSWWLAVRNLTLQRRSDQSLTVEGVVKLAGGVLELDNVRIRNARGKGMWMENGTAYVTNSAIENSTSRGIYSTCSYVTVSNSTVTGNLGGGIEFDYGSGCSLDEMVLQITNSTIENNSTSDRGGGILNNPSGLAQTAVNMNISKSTIASNQAPFGGGIADYGHTVIENSTITSNTATSGPGGGIYRNSSGEFTVKDSTISHNGAATQGGGVFTSGSSFYPFNSIFAKNTAGTNPDFSGLASTNVDHYNLVQNKGSSTGWCTPTGWDPACGGPGHAIVGVDPLLGSLQNLGGPTRVRPLQTGSPAINANPSSGLPTDQRGISRPRGAGYDLGAYEK